MSTATFLSILDCPACRKSKGLVPQKDSVRYYLACPLCKFWYPVIKEVPILLVPEKNPQGKHSALGKPVQFPLERKKTKAFDWKAMTYSYVIRINEMMKTFPISKELVIADIGCSTGSFALALRNQTYIGFDISFPSLVFARKNTGHFFVQADATQLPIKTKSIQCFLSRELLEHVNDTKKAMQELYRIAQYGYLELPTLNFPFAYDPINWILTRLGRKINYGIYGYNHEKLYTIAGWKEQLINSGFKITKEKVIGTGLFLNLFDNVWHISYNFWHIFYSLFSSKKGFESIPKIRFPARLVRMLFSIRIALHRIDTLLLKKGVSQGFKVEARF